MFGGGKRDDEALREAIASLHKELRLKTHEALQHHRDTLGAELKRLQDLVGQVHTEVAAAHRDLVDLAARTEAAHDRLRRMEEQWETHRSRPPGPLPLGPQPPGPRPVAGTGPRERDQRPPERRDDGSGLPGEPEEEERIDHRKLLRAAAGVSAATLVCHRDTWAFVVEQAGRETHFRVPGKVEEKESAVQVAVSGPSLLAVATVLERRISEDSTDPGSRALAWKLYHSIAAEVLKARPFPGPGPGPTEEAPGQPAPAAIHIVIDDRPH
ncbi:hypothetical protein M1P56_13935 [Streptomyces sp. HU2014]|uniref:hypothetical protein n=1 Tax=Streptomyces sp. HU2014 TaxID=2939414 RepID=UPI00200E25AA|nr:hypothetical protein [Streptomyces sp. HU2014]UQI45369.1 hypothetical protein M1P56_13935 [Streptomyces sp. HU2014]